MDSLTVGSRTRYFDGFLFLFCHTASFPQAETDSFKLHLPKRLPPCFWITLRHMTTAPVLTFETLTA
jgi:hypothetical protein